MTTTLASRRTRWGGIRIRFVWYDLWVGAYISRDPLVVYVCPLPTLLVEINLSRLRCARCCEPCTGPCTCTRYCGHADCGAVTG